MFAAAPEDQDPALGALEIPLLGRFIIAFARFDDRGLEWHRCAQLGPGRHEVIGLGRPACRRTARSQLQYELVLRTAALAAKRHAQRPAHPAALHPSHASHQARRCPGPHFIARDRRSDLRRETDPGQDDTCGACQHDQPECVPGHQLKSPVRLAPPVGRYSVHDGATNVLFRRCDHIRKHFVNRAAAKR